MAEYIDREKYCNEICRCDQNYCDKVSCSIWKAPAANVAPVVKARWTNHCCTACGKQAVTCTFSDGTTVYIETPRCPSCGARMNEVEP